MRSPADLTLMEAGAKAPAFLVRAWERNARLCALYGSVYRFNGRGAPLPHMRRKSQR